MYLAAWGRCWPEVTYRCLLRSLAQGGPARVSEPSRTGALQYPECRAPAPRRLSDGGDSRAASAGLDPKTPPRSPSPPPRPDQPVADLSHKRIKRQSVLGGLLNEYEGVA